jgi:hypothetical protein
MGSVGAFRCCGGFRVARVCTHHVANGDVVVIDLHRIFRSLALAQFPKRFADEVGFRFVVPVIVVVEGGEIDDMVAVRRFNNGVVADLARRIKSTSR